jgi:DNA-binding response OmpR family regulator
LFAILNLSIEANSREVGILKKPENSSGGSLARMSESLQSPSRRILLCDDSTVERHVLAQFLRSAGFAVQEAGDGDAAVVYIKNRPIDLILLDLNMPGSDGFDVLSYLQEHHRALPVILLSGMPLNQIQHKMHGLVTPELPPLLLKPIDPDQLLGLIDLQLSEQLFQSTTMNDPETGPASN